MKLAALACMVVPLLAQSSQHGMRTSPAQTVNLLDPIHIQFETWIEPIPRDYAESVVTGFASIEREPAKTIIHRFVRDNFRHVYVSYTVTVETLPETGTYRATFDQAGPVSAPAAEWRSISPQKYPVAQTVQDGDTIALGLYSDARTEQQLVDYIHLGSGKIALRNDAPHDSYADDAEFTIAEPRVRANGVPQERGTLPEMLRGPVLWVYVPGYGRYVLSFKPHPELGFDKAGEVAANSLTFSGSGGNVFRIDSAERIASVGSGIFNVHALRDAAWEPADPADRTRFQMGVAPAVEPAAGLLLR